MILQKPRECFESFQIVGDEVPRAGACSLSEIGRGFSVPEGTGELGVAGIGESLGKEEVWDGKPFRPKAQAGSKLEEILRLAGVPRSKLLLWNIVACQPPDNRLVGTSYGYEAMHHCQVHFRRVMEGLRPGKCGKRVLIAFGAVPGARLTEDRFGLFERGFVLECPYGLVIITFHPAFLKRGNPELTPLVAMDVQRAVEVANETFTNYPSHSAYKAFQVQEFPSQDEVASFYRHVRDNPRLCLFYDIETPKSKSISEEERDGLEPEPIEQIQFATGTVGQRSTRAIVFPWAEPYIKVSKELFKLENPKANWYAYNFDNPRLIENGVEFKGPLHDLLWMFKHYQPRLPRGLQSVAATAGFPFPWKHMFTERPQFYGGCDVIADSYCMSWLVPRMKQLGVWRGYIDEIKDMYTVLQYGQGKGSASERGVPVNEEKRQNLKTEFRKDRDILNKELQGLVPDEIRGVEPKRKQAEGVFDYGYVREPIEILEKCRQSYERWPSKDICSFEEYLDKYVVLRKTDKEGKVKEFRLKKIKQMMRTEDGEILEVERWARILMFKASSQQLIRYIEWKREQLESN